MSDGADWNAGKVLRTVCSSLDISSRDVAEIVLRKDHVMVELMPVAFEKYRRNPDCLSGAALSKVANASRNREQSRPRAVRA